MKEHMPYQADTTRLRSRTQNVCFLISISAAILKLMVKITSNSAHAGSKKNSIAWHFLTQFPEITFQPAGICTFPGGLGESKSKCSSSRLDESAIEIQSPS